MCAGVFPAGVETCRYCGSSLVFVSNMRNRVRQRAAERGVAIVAINGDGFELLSEYGGIGAFLKTTAKRGLN
jgi:hypothetical protein